MAAHARHQAGNRGRHRKPLRAKRQGPVRRISATAGVALIGASAIAVTGAAPPPAPAHQTRAASSDVRLAAASSIFNVPMNLLTDLINVPAAEAQGLDFLSKSLFFSGPWFVVSPTNLWGVDPGDPSHFQSVVQLLMPFPALSGLGMEQSDQNGMGQQVWHTVAVILPVSTYCDAAACTPMVPTSPITGITGIDQAIWTTMILTGQLQFPLINNWLNLNRLAAAIWSEYTFDPTYPGYTDPSGPVYEHPGFPFPGTTGPENTMPWAGTSFSVDVFKPFRQFLRPFNGRSHNEPDPASRPRPIR